MICRIATLLALVSVSVSACTRDSLPEASSADKAARRLVASNQLAGALSPYLRLHADNPVHWQMWGAETLAAARSLDRPIFLSIGYFSCYWCHVMERESFAATDVAELLNRSFVAIKVDREERPDLDEFYMTAVNYLSGRGGWPMTVLLLPTGEPFWGGTYLPHDQLAQLLQQAAQAWQQRRADLEAQAQQVVLAIARTQQPVDAPFPTSATVERARRALLAQVDPQWGGFGSGMKFPMTPTLRFLWESALRRGDQAGMKAVRRTLRQMILGGIYDQVGGGFHRYATDRKWEIPHFEKMLYDNAQLLWLLSDVLPQAGDDAALFRWAAHGTAEFLLRRLYDASRHLFWSATDALVGDVEGGGYRWSPAALNSAIPAALRPTAAAIWNIDGPPNLDGDLVLHWVRTPQEAARRLHVSLDELFARVERLQRALLVVRSEKRQPAVDDKSVAVWNALAAIAFWRAGDALENPLYHLVAVDARDALLRAFWRRGRPVHVVRGDEVAAIPATLADGAAMLLAAAMISDESEATTDWGVEVARWLTAQFFDADAKGFVEVAADMPDLPLPVQRIRDGAVPSGNSLAAQALLLLARAGSDEFLRAAFWAIRGRAAELAGSPTAHAALLDAADAWLAAELPTALPYPARSPRSVDTQSVLQVTAHHRAQQGVEVVLTLADGWHVNANPASYPFLIATEVTAPATAVVAVRYPPAEAIEVAGGQARVAGYRGSVTLVVERAVPDEPLWLRAQACSDDGTCLAPALLPVRPN
ncbi:MAG: DUF255 domain-containing protein [Candidatus Dadabacteria bacterium]|nr:MAG: DUF255 domain-containing protein [Candidatus Dadabacteria bacterium]